MTGIPGCREIRQALGVYVLGAIDPAERGQVDEHLAACPDCREELAGLAGLPALLRRISVADAERLAAPEHAANEDMPSEELLPSLLARAAAVKRAHRWRGLAAAAAVVVVALGAGAIAGDAFLASSPSTNTQAHDLRNPWQTVSATDPRTGATLTVKYQPMAWGTMMRVSVSGLQPGITCRFVVTDAAGKRWVVGDWRLTYQGRSSAWYPASTAISERDLRSFELTSGGRLLAQVSAS